LIEESQYASKPVIVEAVISSSSVSYLVPGKVVSCIEKKDDVIKFEGAIAADDPIHIGFIGTINCSTLSLIQKSPQRRLREKAGSWIEGFSSCMTENYWPLMALISSRLQTGLR